MVADSNKTYDICIIGSGPAGLACLSAIREPYSLDNLNEEQVRRAHVFLKKKQSRQPSVCVIDAQSCWMSKWKDSFDTLKIRHLRSPAMAHPNLFDTNALLAYAVEQNRQDELYESGLFELKELLPLGQSQIGLWKLPSTKLFNDFCDSLVQRLDHDYIQGAAMKLDRCTGGSRRFKLKVETRDEDPHRMVMADHVILAMGPVGTPIIPNFLKLNRPSHRVLQWTELEQVMAWKQPAKTVLVLGGGLTAVQVAQRVSQTADKVVLCSRRPLTSRHFDIPVQWFDRRHTNKCMADFYHKPVQERLSLLKRTRGGGSVPPLYMQDLDRLERLGILQRFVGTPKLLSSDDGCDGKPIQVWVGKEQVEFDAIVLACGYKPNCEAHPLFQSIIDWNKDLEFVGGFPSVTEDLQITNHIFVTGALGSLNTGPDAANLMGIRRAAQIVANSLDCSLSTNRLRNEGNVFPNRFDAFWSSDSDDSSDEEEDSSL